MKSDPARQVMDAIRLIVREIREAGVAAERSVGVSAAQLFVLTRLRAADAPLSLNDLAEQTFTHQSSVSVVVKKLVAQGLVVRAADPRDRRRLALQLSERGRRLLQRAPAATQDRLLAALHALPRPALAALATGLTRVVDEAGLSRRTEKPPMFFEEREEARRRRTSR